ncbi:hypothetical protein [Megasphaera sp.]|uniref:hypothetical protein n=2 Tax=Megasphaera sp. TaxID=2023260 RepID=UPI00307945A9
MTKMERWLAYINRELAILDYNSDHRDAFEEGKAEGRKEGEAKGRKEGEAKGRKEGEAKGRKEGEAQGRTKGRKEGEERLGMLMSLLLKENRHDDVAKAASDADFREKLFKEYGI